MLLISISLLCRADTGYNSHGRRIPWRQCAGITLHSKNKQLKQNCTMSFVRVFIVHVVELNFNSHETKWHGQRMLFEFNSLDVSCRYGIQLAWPKNTMASSMHRYHFALNI